MNFVDVQPDSFLDYAFTSPSPKVVTTKSTRTNRKQNRCCDQCRKGKRACDAAILEDALLDDSKNNGPRPTAFHYSDIYGALAPCSNCKGKKTCSFDWLRSQRESHSKGHSVPPSKRCRTSDTISPHRDLTKQHNASTNEDLHGFFNHFDLAATFAKFVSGPSETISLDDPTTVSNLVPSLLADMEAENSVRFVPEMSENNHVLINRESGKESSSETTDDLSHDATEACNPLASSPSIPECQPLNRDTGVDTPVRRRKRRRADSSKSTTNNSSSCSTPSLTSNLVHSTNSTLLAEGLLKIYHNSFENALSCWVTERTCPYKSTADVARINEARPDWNRIYHHVFRLDRLSANVRGRQLTYAENQAAAKALNFAIYAFATQWAQSSERCNASYPFGTADSIEKSAPNEKSSQPMLEFDRMLQMNTWNEAHSALHAAGDVESFRVVLAQIVFALTQKPVGNVPVEQVWSTEDHTNEEAQVDKEMEMEICDDLLSKLNLVITDRPPTHLEQGLRLIHSLRSRVAMRDRNLSGKLGSRKQYRTSTGCLDEADRATVDLLFWLGVVLDTLSSAMHSRPLVVSDEDSNIYPDGVEQKGVRTGQILAAQQAEGLWDSYLFAHQDSRLQATPVRWPCSFDQAAALLCDAAPVKVLLFRKVTTIQTLITRGTRGSKVEASLCSALDLVAHWTKLYAPFIQDCIQHHDQLHPRIQSWYTCLAGHWHLAASLLEDLIEIVDESKRGMAEPRSQRVASSFVAHSREKNCQIVSDLAERACPRVDASFAQSKDFHFALSQGSILTEPWTVVLIHVFAKVGVILLEADTMLPSKTKIDDEDNFRRADQCVRALWYLGRKSDMAIAAANILGNALRERRQQSVVEKMSDMSSFLEAKIWHGLDHQDAAIDGDGRL